MTINEMKEEMSEIAPLWFLCKPPFPLCPFSFPGFIQQKIDKGVNRFDNGNLAEN